MVSFFKVPFNTGVLGAIGPADQVNIHVGVNVPSGEIVYAADNWIFASGPVRRFKGGIGELELPTKVGANPVDFEYMLEVEIARPGEKPKTYGPYYKPAPTSTADAPLAGWVGESSVPATWMTTATATLQAKVDEAEAIKQYVTDVSNIDTTVSAVDFALGQPGPAATLSAAIGAVTGPIQDDLDAIPATIGTEIATPGTPARTALDVAIAAQITESVGTSLAAVTASLDAPARSFGVQVLGDSTGNAADEWVYEVAQAIATENPALTVHHRVWNDTTQDYSAPTVIQTGTAGVLAMPCTAAKQTRRLPASMSPHLSGILDVRVKMSLTDWTPSVQHVFTGKTDAAGVRGWWAGINNTASGNRPFFTFSTDGTALTTTTVIGAPTVADGATLWMRWVFNPNDGAGNRTLAAYQSTDGVAWTQIGATVTTAGAVTLFNNSTVGYALGGEGSGTNAAGATIYEVQIRDGLNGPSVVPLLPDLWPPNAVSTANTVAVTGAPVLTFVNGSHPGANLAYWSDPTRLKLATPPLGQKATFISLSHNQGTSFGADFLGSYDALRAPVEARLPGVPTVVVVQNPQKSAEVGAAQHAQRRLDLIGHARQKGLGLIDVYKAFLAYGEWSTDLMADGIHPNAAGEDLWRDTVLAAFGPR